jgi:predicted negative regulator of RcsB-dependent stress response
MKYTAIRIAGLVGAALLTACAGLPGVDAEPAPPVSANSAVVALVDDARSAVGAGKPDAAGAALERALRIEPRNAALWQELARLRLSQGQYQQAESLAARSNSYAGTDRRLRALNWRLIGDARNQLGDVRGAEQAYARADEFER